MALLSFRRLAGVLFVALGAAGIAWYGVEIARQTWFQAQARASLQRVTESGRSMTPSASSESPPASPVLTNNLIGQLEIPRLHVSVVVMEGDDDATLKKAVGHLPDTAMPWDEGNSAFAGHRDTFFRPLKDVRKGDEIRMTSVRGTFTYRVLETRVVDPSDVDVIAPTPRPELTLVTCYPFYYVGNAPRRYIVRAERTESASTPPPAEGASRRP